MKLTDLEERINQPQQNCQLLVDTDSYEAQRSTHKWTGVEKDSRWWFEGKLGKRGPGEGGCVVGRGRLPLLSFLLLLLLLTATPRALLGNFLRQATACLVWF